MKSGAQLIFDHSMRGHDFIYNPDGSISILTPAPFSHYELIAIEDWKPGAKRVHLKRNFHGRWEFIMAFCPEEFIPAEKGRP